MSFKAILHLSGQNIVLDYVDLELNQSVDARSRPASMTRGGTITVEFDTPSDGDMIADWAANPVKQLDGSITYMNQNQDSVMKTINFYNAYCIEFMERFDGTMSSSNMKTTIKISPERVNIGGVEHDNNWFVHGTSKGAGAEAVTSSSGIASKEGTEFEKGTVVESKQKEVIDFRKSYAKNDADPARDVMGSGVDSHPKEWNEIIDRLKKEGVEVKLEEGERMAFSPGGSANNPGQLILSEDASYSALLHEYQHHLDNKNAGYKGMRGLFDAEFRKHTETNAYTKEIEFMEQNGHKEAANQLRKNLQKELNRIEKEFGGTEIED